MDTVAHRPGSDGGDGTRTFLPPESPTVMPKQSLRGFRSGEEKQRAVLSSMAFRRAWIFTGTAALTMAGCYEMHQVLNVGGVTALEWIVLCLFVLLFAWIAFSFMSALAGFVVLLFRTRDPLGIDPDAPLPSIGSKNAMLLPTYNEDPGRIMARLGAMCESIEQSGYGSRFDWFILSDTTNPSVWIAEERCFLRLRQDLGASNIFYRHRPENSARKSGDIEEWIKRFGAGYDHMVILDADSLMTADAVLRLVRIMQADPRLGILQGLIVGLPSTSAFARIFQFGMRLGMRSYTIGSAWWQGDCGPYWGHNAVLRLKPFIAHCALPVLSRNGTEDRHILSHDQIEAVLMRTAGYDVRVLPQEDLGWEENPPTLLEFIRRDLRWCQGNMQYWRFLSLPGLKPVSRYQLALAILMFIGSPAWIGLLVLGTLAQAFSDTPGSFIRADAGMALLVCVLVMWFAPKIASAIDILLRPELRRAFGGTGLFIISFTIETVYSILLCPILWFGHTLFLIGLLFGREIGWIGQTRDDHAVPFTLALQNLWPHTLLGCAVLGLLAVTQPAAIPYALFLAGGPALAIPFAMMTASPWLGSFAARIGIGRLPEETARPAVLLALALPAIEQAAPSPRPSSV